MEHATHTHTHTHTHYTEDKLLIIPFPKQLNYLTSKDSMISYELMLVQS